MVIYTPSAPPDHEIERQIRVELARKNPVWFTEHYLRTDEGERFHFADFQVEMIEVAASDEERVIFLEPAAHGKTTLVAKAYPIWLVCCFPNVRIKLGSKNSQDAEDRLFAIKQELEHNEMLIEDFGMFVSDVWREKEILVAQRTIRDLEPTIRAFGSETSIIGSRATHLILDDVVSEKNSGAHVEEGTRRKLSTEFHTTFKKLGYPKRKLVIRWVQTVVDQRDLVHECANLHGQMPEDDRTRWRSDKNFLVIRHQALDETVPSALWPEMHSVDELLVEKAEDVISFLKRMQNRTLDPEMLSFQRSWFEGDRNSVPPAPGCLDYTRKLGEMPQVDGLTKLTLASGFDPNPGQSETSKWCAYVELAFDKNTKDDRRIYWVTDIIRFRGTIVDQVHLVVERTMQRGVALAHVESNVQNQWLMQLPEMRSAVSSGFRIEPHHTNVKNKPDPDTGVPSMAMIVREGRWRLAYGDERSRQMAEIMIGEFVNYPQGVTKDTIMAGWFAKLAAEKVAKRKGLRVYAGSAPGWLRMAGDPRAMVEQYFPTVRPK